MVDSGLQQVGQATICEMQFFVALLRFVLQKISLRSLLFLKLHPSLNQYEYKLCKTMQVYPKSWTAVYLALDNVGMWNIRSENWARQYLGQQFYLRVYTSSTSLRDEYPVPRNALLCGRAKGRRTRPF